MSRQLTFGLITANVIVFLLIFSMPEELMESAFQALSLSRGTSFEVWRWITSLFMHGSASHLFFNMLGLYFFGKILEEEVPREWFLAIYFVAGLLGSLLFLLVSPEAVVGASGAMFGVMGAAMLLNPVKRVHFYIFPLPLAIVALAFVIFESLIVLFRPEQLAAQVENVANEAHIAGIITGALFAFFYNPKRSMKGMFVLLVALLLLIVLGPVFALIAGLGGIGLQILDFVIGTVLYTAAGGLSFLWG